MKKLYISALAGTVSALLLLASLSASAQQPGQPGQGGPGGKGGRGNFDPAAFMDRMMGEMQKQLKANDDEWKILRPLIETVYTKGREVRGAGGSSMFGGRQRSGSPGQTETAREVQALKDILERENASAADIKPRLDAFREYKAKKEAELKDAREKLRAVLTAKQEAQLVMAGLLD
jgi:hypothetical protein